MNCLFCHGAENDGLSREHLVSEPVAKAFGIDRDDVLATVNNWTPGDDTVDLVRMPSIRDLSVKLPCRRCNSGWMNDLEHGMGSVAKWTRDGRSDLTVEAHTTLLRWLLKTYIVMAAIDGGSRRFGTSDDFHLIPDATRARQLWEGDPSAVSNVTYGFARWGRAHSFTYAFGNPAVIPVGPKYANCRSAGAFVLNVGTLSCCVVVPMFEAAVSLPAPYADLAPGARYRSLPLADRIAQVDEIVVDNGEHDWDLVTQQLATWAAEPQSS